MIVADYKNHTISLNPQVFIKFSVNIGLPWSDFLYKTDHISHCSCKFFGFLFKSSCHILCHSITGFSPVMEH